MKKIKLLLFLILCVGLLPAFLVVSKNKIISPATQKEFRIKGYALENGIFSSWDEQQNKVVMPLDLAALSWTLSEHDIAALKQSGVTTVRYCLNYEIFSADNNLRENNFKHFEQMLALFEKNKIHIVVNLHVPPGYAGAIRPTDASFFEDTKLWQQFEGFWREFLTKYQDKKIIIGWEFFNEPALPLPEVLSESAWYKKVDDFLQAMRAIDQNHIFFVGNPIGHTVGFNRDSTRNIEWRFIQFKRKFNDTNLVYVYHFYEPIHFTHQNTHEFLIKGIKYPLIAYEYENYLDSQGGNTVVEKGPNGWFHIKISNLVPPAGANYGNPVLSAAQGKGRFYFDRVRIYEITPDGEKIELSLPNPDFKPYLPDIAEINGVKMYKDIDYIWWDTYYSEKYEPERNKNKIPSYRLETTEGIDDNFCISLENPSQELANWTLDPRQFFIEPKPGCKYEMECWAKTANGNELWVGISWYQGKEVKYDIKYLEELVSKNFVSFGQQYNVPIYISEFGSVAFAEISSRENWTKDILKVFTKHNINYSYWCYNGKYGWGYDFGLRLKNPFALEQDLITYQPLLKILEKDFQR